MRVYCQIVGDAGENSRPCWVKCVLESGLMLDKMGPYRDKTDAETAVIDRAEIAEWEVEWVY